MATIKITKMDFEPKGGGSYNINWPGPPRRQLKYSDVKHYTPLIELDKQTPIGFTIKIYAKEYREAFGVDELMSDIVLTYFSARFEVGNRNPSEVKMVNHIAGPPKDPEGSPQYTFGSFWLGVSKGGKIRGNIGTGDDGHARVYLELQNMGGSMGYFWIPDAPGHELTGKRKSPKHTIRAI